MPVIHVADLVKSYRKTTRPAVNGITFDVEPGEFFAFLGPNGAGKTTTISILTTTLSKTSGEVSIEGLDIDRDAAEVRRRVGIIFQNPSIDLNLTAEENIRFHSVLYGVFPFRPTFAAMPQAYKDRVRDLAELIGIGKDLGKPVKTFSGGMKRKLEIIRTLVHEPKVLFLDEPTVGLDPESRRNLWHYINETRKQSGITVFLTTHYLDEVEGADRVCIINEGRIAANDRPDRLKKKLAREYILLDSKDRKGLTGDVRALGYEAETTEAGIKVLAGTPEDIKRLLTGLRTELSAVDIQKPTLEDAYLDILRRTQAEGAHL